MPIISLAKTRTRTGCLTCRQRRKKCDEARPYCMACTRNAIQCSWSSNEKAIDKRRNMKATALSQYYKMTPSSSQSKLETELEIVRPDLCPLGLMPSPFQLESHRYLYWYFGSVLLPKLVRQNSLARYTDQTYMLRLGLEFPPLMGSFISIAGMHLASLSSSSKWSVCCAVQSYVQTIVMLREALAQPCNFGSDALLATVITLSVFETSRIDSTLKVAPHVTASGYLLGKRRGRYTYTSPQATAVFDRICVESFVYHASLMMLFDPSLDALSDRHCREVLSKCFSHSEHPTQPAGNQALATQPVLHTSYEFFLLIADATRLARIPGSLDENQVSEWVDLQYQVERYSSLISDEQDLCTRLYVLALRILLLKSHPNPGVYAGNDFIESYALEGRRIIPFIDSNRYFASFLLWPLAVVGSVSLLGGESAVVRDYVSLLAVSRLGGQAVSVLRRLDKLWAFGHGVPVAEEGSLPRCIRRCRGLQILLDGEDDAEI